jgi:hypothetical protein
LKPDERVRTSLYNGDSFDALRGGEWEERGVINIYFIYLLCREERRTTKGNHINIDRTYRSSSSQYFNVHLWENELKRMINGRSERREFELMINDRISFLGGAHRSSAIKLPIFNKHYDDAVEGER